LQNTDLINIIGQKSPKKNLKINKKMDRYRTTNRATLFPELDEQQQRPSQASDRMVVGGLTYRGSGFPSGALPPSLPRPPVEMEMRKLRAVATQRPSSIPPVSALDWALFSEP
jgi:hypothetical protein